MGSLSQQVHNSDFDSKEREKTDHETKQGLAGLDWSYADDENITKPKHINTTNSQSNEWIGRHSRKELCDSRKTSISNAFCLEGVAWKWYWQN